MPHVEEHADGTEFLDPPKSNGSSSAEPAYAVGEEPF